MRKPYLLSFYDPIYAGWLPWSRYASERDALNAMRDLFLGAFKDTDRAKIKDKLSGAESIYGKRDSGRVA